MTTNKPEVIYLIDTGDGVVWCDDRDLTGYDECDEAVKYVRGDAYEALQAECEKLARQNADAEQGQRGSMTTKNTGGPAFPSAIPVNNDKTLRDWFAGMAMQGLLAAQIYGFNDSPAKGPFASMAYEMADAMLKARDEE